MTSIDSQQWTAFVVRSGAALVLYARQWCSDPDDAVQEAFLELSKLDVPPDDPLGWLFTATRRRAINQTRSDSRRRKRNERRNERHNVSRNELASDPLRPISPAWFESELESREEIEKLQTELEKLDPVEREIVVAHIWGELSFAQIAKLVELSSSTVHRRYQSALAQLRLAWENPPTHDSSDGTAHPVMGPPIELPYSGHRHEPF